MSAQDCALNSNLSSTLLRTLWASKNKVADLSYSMGAAYPNILYYNEAISPFSTPPTGQSVAGTTVQYYINRMGMWDQSALQLIVTGAGTTTKPTLFRSFYIFNNIQLASNNATLITLYPQYMYARTICSMTNEKMRRQSMANWVHQTHNTLYTYAQNFNATTFKTYVPLFCPSFENVVNALDLSFVEQLRLICQFNADVNAGINTSSPGDAWNGGITTQLFSQKHLYDNLSLQDIKSKNFPKGGTYAALWYDSYVESQVLRSTNGTSVQLTQNISYVVRQNYLMVQENGSGGYTFDPLIQIETYSLQIGGSYLTPGTSIDYLVQDYFSKKENNELSYPMFSDNTMSTGVITGSLSTGGASSAATTSSVSFTATSLDGTLLPVIEKQKVLHVSWADKPNDRCSNTGALSYSSLNTPIWTVTYNTIGSPTYYTLFCVSEYLTLIDVNCASGQVQKAIAI